MTNDNKRRKSASNTYKSNITNDEKIMIEWTEEIASQQQFNGFSIYGHTNNSNRKNKNDTKLNRSNHRQLLIQQQDEEYYESLRRDRQREQNQQLAIGREHQQPRQQDSVAIASHPQRVTSENHKHMDQNKNLKGDCIEKQNKQHKERVEGSQCNENEKIKPVPSQKEQLILLEPEPSKEEEESGQIATIAFKLPGSCKKRRIIRRFHKNALAQQMMYFIQSEEFISQTSSSNSMQRKKHNQQQWRLCQVIGGFTKEIASGQSLQDLGLVPRGLVIVQRIEDEDEEAEHNANDAGDHGVPDRSRTELESAPRQATYTDECKWKEEKNSHSQFGGFNIYGRGNNADDGALFCGTCINSSIAANGSNYNKGHEFTMGSLDCIHNIAEIPHLPGNDQARSYLERLCREFSPVVRARGWEVWTLTEMCCCGDGGEYIHSPSGNSFRSNAALNRRHEVMGYCVPHGDKRTSQGIHIRLRRNVGGNQYDHISLDLLPYEEIASTMAHELAHIVHALHNEQFFDLMKEIEQERLDFLSRHNDDIEGFPIPFLSSGRRLGGDDTYINAARRGLRFLPCRKEKAHQCMEAALKRQEKLKQDK